MAKKTKKSTNAKAATKKTVVKKKSAPVKRATTAAVERAGKAVKKAVARKATKAVAQSVIKKKPAVKKAVVKKTPTAKAAVKKAAVQKIVIKSESASTAVKKSPPKKVAEKQPVAKKSVVKKVVPKAPAVKKAAVKKTAAKKTVAAKPTVKKATTKKTVTAKKTPAKKAVAPKAKKIVKNSAKKAVAKSGVRKAHSVAPQDIPILMDVPAESIPETIPVPIRPFDAQQDLSRIKELIRQRIGESEGGWLDLEDRDVLVLMVKDPWWVFAYWNISEAMEKRAQAMLKTDEIPGMCRALRVYDVTDLAENLWPGDKVVKQVVFSDMARHWYIHTDSPGRKLIAEVGLLTQRGRFIGMIRSYPVTSPSMGFDMLGASADYWALFQMAVGYEGELGAVDFAKLFARDLSSASLGETLSSIGLLSSWSQDIHAEGNYSSGARQFRLWLDTELIVYGGTDPQAQLTIMGQPVKLRPDGTFSLRMHLPNGIHAIPVEAISPDGIEKRAITPVVTRQTTAHQSFIRPRAAARTHSK